MILQTVELPEVGSTVYKSTAVPVPVLKSTAVLLYKVLPTSGNSTVCNIMKENKLLTMRQLLTKELIVFMFKQKKGKNPIAFKDIFIKN